MGKGRDRSSNNTFGLLKALGTYRQLLCGLCRQGKILTTLQEYLLGTVVHLMLGLILGEGNRMVLRYYYRFSVLRCQFGHRQFIFFAGPKGGLRLFFGYSS